MSIVRKTVLKPAREEQVYSHKVCDVCGATLPPPFEWEATFGFTDRDQKTGYVDVREFTIDICKRCVDTEVMPALRTAAARWRLGKMCMTGNKIVIIRVQWMMRIGGYQRAFVAIWEGGRWQNFETPYRGFRSQVIQQVRR